MAKSANHRSTSIAVPEPERASDAMISRSRAEVESSAKRLVRRALLPILRWDKKLAEVGEGFQWDIGSGFKIGPESRLGRYAYLGRDFEANGPVSLGDFVMVAAGCTIIGSDHLYDQVGVPTRLAFADTPRKPTIFGVDAWVGQNVTIREGLTIGRGAVVAAASMVVRDVPPYTIVAGVPAKVLRSRFNPDEILTHDAHVPAKPLPGRQDV